MGWCKLTCVCVCVCAQGKSHARNELRKRMNLQGWGDKAIIAVVSRLTPQKGVHLIKHAAYRALERGCQFVLLGSAPDPKLQVRGGAECTLTHTETHTMTQQKKLTCVAAVASQAVSRTAMQPISTLHPVCRTACDATPDV